MRPVRRDTSPHQEDFNDYREALPYLISRLGPYCSYCERNIQAGLAVEHIEPKGPVASEHLKGSWTNFLLACVNCNATKKDRPVDTNKLLFPDRDNTFIALKYQQDGQIVPSATSVAEGIARQVTETLALTGLDKPVRRTQDANGTQIAYDRASQRMEAWGLAIQARDDLDGQPFDLVLQKWIIESAIRNGFFSIWMAVFQDKSELRNKLIEAFPGTRQSGCFDAAGVPCSPAPNPDRLPGGGKI